MLGQQAGSQEKQATSLLYCGEQFDSGLQNYYLRARHYDQSNGRFNRLDPFAGNHHDPQSLHKYAYAHCDPVNGMDPSGEFTLKELLVWIVIVAVVLALVLPTLVKAVKAVKGVVMSIWLMLSSDPISQSHLDDAIEKMRSKWPAEPKMKELANLLKDEVYNVNVMDTGKTAGRYFQWTRNTLYVSHGADEEPALILALLIFAEFQHSPEGGALDEAAAQEEFDRIRDMLPEDDRTEDINKLTHGKQ